MKPYVLGFMLDDGTGTVNLIRKNRPAWQLGKLNGIGGKVEDFDPSLEDAMVREFVEETGVATDVTDWRLYAVMRSEQESWIVYCFAAKGSVWRASSMTDELVGVYHTDKLPSNALISVRYLIPLALDPALTKPVVIDYDRVENP